MREENNLFNLTDKIEEVQAFSRADDISKSIGLQEDTVLQGRYIIEKKISQNSESFSYLGFDKVHDKKIHIREFFPKDFCKREKDFSVTVENKDEFNIYLSDFLGFFRSIAKLKEVAVVQQVYDIFKENSTAYVVSEWIEGMTFERFIEKNNEPMTWEEAKYIFMPVLSALRTINSLKVQHLGVSPEHLIIGQDSKMHLIGFSTKNACQCGNFSTWQISSGCTAPEQYFSGSEIGEFTDVYGFCASLFFALAGTRLKETQQRTSDERILIPMKILNELPEGVTIALAKGLQLDEKKRIGTFEELRKILSGAKIEKLVNEPAKVIEKPKEKELPAIQKKAKKKLSNKAIVFISMSAVILCLFSFWFIFFGGIFQNSNQGNTEKGTDFSLNQVNKEELIEVDSLIGMDVLEAQKKLEEEGKYKILISEKEFNDTMKEGLIVSQIPNKGEKIKKGSVVVVNVSKGAFLRVLPEIKGDTFDQVVEKLKSQGFTAVENQEYSDTFEIDKVVGYKDKSAGEKMEYGSAVEVIVSKGRENPPLDSAPIL